MRSKVQKFNEASKRLGRATAVVMLAAAALGAGPASAQSGGFSGWNLHDRANGVEVYFAYRVDRDEIRVAWKCVNRTGSDKSCSVGAGQNKTYFCYRDGTAVGVTGSLGERATVRAGSEYGFPTDFACRGKGANDVRPSARISIED